MNELEYKCCPCCDTWKLLSEFSKIKSRKDGLNVYCKKCYSEKRKKWTKTYRELNSEQIKDRDKAFHWQNKQKRNIKSKNFLLNNHNEINKRRKAKYKMNPDKFIIRSQMRKSHKKSCESSLTIKEWKYIKQYFNDTFGDRICPYCNRVMIVITQDHFTPLNKGGGYSITNIIPCCKSCNSSKQDMDFYEWYKQYPLANNKNLEKIKEWFTYINNTLK